VVQKTGVVAANWRDSIISLLFKDNYCRSYVAVSSWEAVCTSPFRPTESSYHSSMSSFTVWIHL